jgi:uncharacterized SAM-binding protein YcdF (DUF218 family)
VTRVVAVLGYSDGSTAGLHPTCAARLERAAALSTADDVVLLSGWSRGSGRSSEAELMAAAWNGPARRLVLDRGARSTAGNAIAVGRVARAIGAREVVVVTSPWHGGRALVLVRAALVGAHARARVATTAEPAPRELRLRELVCWSLVPLLSLVAARTR